MDSTDKPRLRERRTPYEYVMWLVCAAIVAGIGHTLLTNPRFGWSTIGAYLTARSTLRGLWLTIWLTCVVMVVGTLLGLLLAVMKASKVPPVRYLAEAYIAVFRGTPVLVQLILWFNIAALYPDIRIGIPFLHWGHQVDTNALINANTAAIIGLSLNEAAYMAEIIRGGFQAVSKGQLEAADTLGLSDAARMRRIIIPQAMPTVIPATGNQLISMLKETSLVSVLGVADLLQSVQLVYAQTYQTIPMLLVACIWYLVISILLGFPQRRIEAYYNRSRAAIGTQSEIPTEAPA